MTASFVGSECVGYTVAGKAIHARNSATSVSDEFACAELMYKHHYVPCARTSLYRAAHVGEVTALNYLAVFHFNCVI